MLNDLAIAKLAGLQARHAAARHATLAENIANADTPGFKAKDLEPFADALHRARREDPDAAFRTLLSSAPGSESPNGNTVAIEDQMRRTAEAVKDHETATLIYAKAASLLRSILGKAR